MLFGLFVLFLYGPIATIVMLAFQGPEGGLVFPMNGVSLHWFGELFRPQSIGDIWGSFDRSIALGAIVMVLTVVFSLLAGLAFRRRFAGSSALFYLADRQPGDAVDRGQPRHRRDVRDAGDRARTGTARRSART